MTSLQQQEPKARPEFGKIFLNTSTAKDVLVNDISIYLDLSLESDYQFKSIVNGEQLKYWLLRGMEN